jgi:hypothetical protein
MTKPYPADGRYGTSVSTRRLHRRMLRWRRYAERTYWNPRVSVPDGTDRYYLVPPGHWEVRMAVWERIEHRWDCSWWGARHETSPGWELPR